MSVFVYFWNIFFCTRIISLIGFCVIKIQKSACAAFLANDVLYFIPKHRLQFVYPKVSHGFLLCFSVAVFTNGCRFRSSAQWQSW